MPVTMVGKRGRRGRPRRSEAAKKKPKFSEEDLCSLFSSLDDAISLARGFLHHKLDFLDPAQAQVLESSISAAAISLSTLHSSPSLPPHSPPQTLTLEIPPPKPHPLFPDASEPSPDSLFKECFHISKSSFDTLLQIISPSLKKSPDNAVAPDRKLAAALFRLARAATFKAAGGRFGLETAAACRAFYEVCKAVNDNFANDLQAIQSDQSRILNGFAKISLPNCCGVLGFGQFSIESGTDGDGAVIVQALVDAEGNFLDISAGWPGSVPPDGILYRTKLFSRVVESKDMLSGPHHDLDTGDSIPQYVLGDSRCPLLPWLLTPYREPTVDYSHQIFNSVHRRGMELANNAFGRVLDRWELLALTWKREFVDIFPFIIIAGCLLHNFLIRCDDTALEIKCDEPALECVGDYSKEQRFPEHGREKSEIGDGESVRAVLASHLSLSCQRA